MATQSPRIQDALSEILSALHYPGMARDVLTVTDPDQLRDYSRIALNLCPAEYKLSVAKLLLEAAPLINPDVFGASADA